MVRTTTNVVRSSDARQRLIDSATELFHVRSYGGVSVEALCRHADVRKGSFYHFFPSKRDLALAAITDLSEQVKEEIWRPIFSQALPPA